MKDTSYDITEKTKFTPSTTPEKLSRYQNYYRLTDTNGDSYLESPEQLYIQQSANDQFYAVEKGYENRIDLISYKFYGTPLLWWAIAVMNNITNPLDVKAGIILRIPDLLSINESGVLS